MISPLLIFIVNSFADNTALRSLLLFRSPPPPAGVQVQTIETYSKGEQDEIAMGIDENARWNKAMLEPWNVTKRNAPS